MSVVIDASVALKWVMDEAGTEAALALRTEQLIAPELRLAEAANVLWRHVRLGELSANESVGRLSELASAPVTSLPTGPHVVRALELATEIGHPVYDCIYLALALRHDTYVVTDDRRFEAAARRRRELKGRVRLLDR